MLQLLLGVIYLAFISLGLPDALLGSAWPSIYPALSVPVSWMGILTAVISCGTVASSLMSETLVKRLGTGKVTLISVGMTCLALLGFSVSRSFFSLVLWAVPYGLGAGSVDACLNNYVALHYKSSHMNWLHCMWGVGASIGPSIMGRALAAGKGWRAGYFRTGMVQAAITLVLWLSLPLWKEDPSPPEEKKRKTSLSEVLRLPGARETMACFLCYCGIETTLGQWASSFLVLQDGMGAEQAAHMGSLFYLGITVGRAACGFASMKLDDHAMIRAGEGILLAGLLGILLPLGVRADCAGLVLAGAGCAPIYPALIHAAPARFGKEKSQAVIGMEMASAYVGTTALPPLFGLIAQGMGIRLLPWYAGILAAMMILLDRRGFAKAGIPR